jgi:hypothetical protein
MTEQTQLSIEEVESMMDSIRELIVRCARMSYKAGDYRAIVQTVIADLLKAYYDMLHVYLYLRKER